MAETMQAAVYVGVIEQDQRRTVYVSVIERYKQIGPPPPPGGKSVLKTVDYVLEITEGDVSIEIPISADDALGIAEGFLRSAIEIKYHEERR
jgi:hypothetical protein